MFFPDNVPIIAKLPKEWDYANIYFVHDLHYGSKLFNEKKWKAYKERIAADDRSVVLWIGDLMENAVPNSKSDMFTQFASPQEQKEFVSEQLTDLKDKTLAVVAGNHENNRSTKLCGLYPLYDCCSIAGISEKYRDTYAIIDIAVGVRKDHKRQIHYVGQIQHKAKDIKSCSSADFSDGIDFFAYGHDHDPHDHPRKKLVYDAHNKNVIFRNVEVIDCGSFCNYGGYGAKGGYRPQSDKIYSLTIFGDHRAIETRGFYV